jgi:AsmA protein
VRRRPSLRKLLLGIAAIIALLVVAAFLAPLIVSSDFVKREIAQLVAARTGRECRIDGQLRFSLLPRPEITADDVSLANAEGGVAAHLIEVNRVEASFRLLPLLRGRLVAERVELVQPQLHAEIDKNGRPNWLFHRPANADVNAESSLPGPNTFVVAQLRIVSGIFNYLDQRDGKALTVPNISLDASLLKNDGSADAVGAAAWNGDMPKFTAHAASFSALWGEGSDVALSVTSGWANFAFKGKASLADKGTASGAVSFKSPSLHEMFKWAGFPGTSREFPYLSPASVDGTIVLGPKNLSLTDATLLGPITAKGGFSFDRGTNRPIVKGNLHVTALDLDPYVDAAASTPGPAATPNPATAHAAPSQASAPEPTPIFVPRLGKVQLNLIMTIDATHYHGVSIGKTFLNAALNQPSGRSLISIGEMALYGGQVGGNIFIDAKPAGPPSLSAKLNLTKIDAGPLLHALSGGDVLTGRGDLTADLQATGSNWDELIASLSGSGHVALANGILTGTVVQPGDIVLPRLENNGQSPSAQLPYDSISTDFAIAHGVLTTKNLKLSSPKMSATGDGSVTLSPCQVDYHWLPVIPGKGNAQIAVSGPCEALSYRAMIVTITPNNKK